MKVQINETYTEAHTKTFSGQLAQLPPAFRLSSSGILKPYVKALRVGETDECFTSTSALQTYLLPAWQWKTDAAGQICFWSMWSKPARESNPSMSLITHPRVNTGVISLQQDGMDGRVLMIWSTDGESSQSRGSYCCLTCEALHHTNSSPGINKVQPYLKRKHVATAAYVIRV